LKLTDLALTPELRRERPQVTIADHVLVFAEDRDRASALARVLEESSAIGDSKTILTFHDLKGDLVHSAGLQELRSGLPALAIVVETDRSKVAFPGVAELARQKGVASLLVVDGAGDPASLTSRARGYDDWVELDAIDRELPARVAVLLDGLDRRARGEGEGRFSMIDPRFLALVVHDLRTPLNVIGLTIRAITQTVPDRSAELDEDLTFLKENAGQIEKMLSQLGDYCRLIEGESQISAAEFDPRRFLADFLEVHRSRPGVDAPPVKLELAESGPVEVSLDQNRVKLAIQHCLANALNAAGKSPVKIRSSGDGDRWIVEFIVDKPPPQTVVSRTLRPDVFERLAGSAAERRGLDLALAAHVSKLFGGTARLDVEPDRRSTIVLDWPRRLAPD
jgi:signal transduction histidine kinase